MRRWRENAYKQKTPAPFEGRRISVWEPQGNLRLLLFTVLAYQHRMSALAKLSADERTMLVDVALVVRSQERAFIVRRIIGRLNHFRKRKFRIVRHRRSRDNLVDNLVGEAVNQADG